MRKLATKLDTLRERPFRLFFIGRLVSLTGTAVAPIALAFAVLQSAGSASALGWVLAANITPQVLFTLVGGVVADRLPRIKVMVAANVTAATSQALTALLLISGTATTPHLIALAALTGLASAFFQPAAQGVIPQLVSRKHIQEANALIRLTSNIVKVGAPAVGGIVVAVVGPGWAIAWDAASFLLAALVLGGLRIPLTRTTASTFGNDFREGWRQFWSRTWLWVLAVQGAVDILLWLVGYQLVGPLYAQASLGGARSWGFVVSALAIGLVIGAAIALLWHPRRVGVVVCFGTGSMAVPLVAMAAGASLVPVLLAAMVTGVGLSISMVSWSTALQQRIPVDQLGRINSYCTLSQLILVPFGYALAGPLVDAIGLTTTLWAFALLIGIATVTPLLVTHVRDLMREDHGEEHTSPSAEVDRQAQPVVART